jgi:hypothetical protein
VSSVKTIRDVLAAVPAITALTQTRIEPNERKDANVYPAIVLKAESEPINHLTGWAGSDRVTVTINYWASSYEGAHSLADLGRAALEAAGYILTTELDDFDEDAGLTGKSCVTQTLTYCS